MNQQIPKDVLWASDQVSLAAAEISRLAFGRKVDALSRVPIGDQFGKTDDEADAWLQSLGQSLGLDILPIVSGYGSIPRTIQAIGPAILRVDLGNQRGYIALHSVRRGVASLITPHLDRISVPFSALVSALRAPKEGPAADSIAQTFCDLGVAKTDPLGQSILDVALQDQWIACGWMIRPSRGDLRLLAKENRLLQRLLGLTLFQVASSLLWVTSWWLLASIESHGRTQFGWFVAWAMLLLTASIGRAIVSALIGGLAIRIGMIVKQRLLLGALAQDRQRMRLEGVGALTGAAIESDSIDQNLLTGGLLGLCGSIDLVIAFSVLPLGSGGAFQTLTLLMWICMTALLAIDYFGRRREWTLLRLGLTADLIERMQGHRTAAVQGSIHNEWRRDDTALDDYLQRSRSLDDRQRVLQVLLPRAWMLVGLLGLIPSFVSGEGPISKTAIGLGGILLAANALRNVAEAIEKWAGVAVAWERVSPLWKMGHAPPGLLPFLPNNPNHSQPETDDDNIRLKAHDITFRHHPNGTPVLNGIELTVRNRDRLLIEGLSGSGKTTFAEVLAGLRRPESGLLLWDGLDLPTLGPDGWRKRVTLVPQFHDNHIVLGSFAFNVLMGRNWPASGKEMEEADRVCRGLGLGPLIDRMPAGMMQAIGETGWRLSHGERSRVFLARALLQKSEFLILDETFGALDPETLRLALQFTLATDRAIAVVAHP
jgi:ATP-binding cassette subfamily B protein